MGKIIGAITGANAAKRAGKVQADAARQGTAETRRQFDLTRQDFAPFRESGVNSLAMLSNALGVNGADPQNDFVNNFQNDPGFQDQVDFGLRGVENSLAARGLGNSGRALRELQSFGQLQRRNAFNDRLNRLSSLAGMGQNTTVQGANIGAGLSNNIVNGIQNAGNARASGFQNASNANIGFANNLLKIGSFAAGGGFG